jgi:hypothetical protein
MQTRNPYAAPKTRLADPPSAPGSPIKAVVFGLVTDIAGSTIAYIVMMFAYGIYLGVQGLSPGQIAAMASFNMGSWTFYAGIALGTAFSALGGYVCARVSRRREYLLGAIVAALSGLFGLVVGHKQYSALVNVLFLILGLVAVMLGTHWGYRRNRRAAT